MKEPVNPPMSFAGIMLIIVSGAVAIKMVNVGRNDSV